MWRQSFSSVYNSNCILPEKTITWTSSWLSFYVANNHNEKLPRTDELLQVYSKRKTFFFIN